jgi:hypothetical protein
MAQLGPTEVGVPAVLIGSRFLVGHDDDASTGAESLALIEVCRQRPCADPLGGRVAAPPERGRFPERLRMPLLGELELRRLSLPALTVLPAGPDGFNPCAMWTLVFLIGGALLLRRPDLLMFA